MRRALRTIASVIVGTLIVVVFSVTGRAWAYDTNGRTLSADAVSVSRDDNGVALFQATNLAPGKPVVNCVAVSYHGPSDAVLTLTGTAAGTGLAPHLDMQVDAGRGGRFGTCDGFAGRRLFTGTLDGFATASRSTGAAPVAVAVGDGESVVFRFRFVLDDDPAAEALAATAAFTWQVTGEAPATAAVPEIPAIADPGEPPPAAPDTTVPAPAPPADRPPASRPAPRTAAPPRKSDRIDTPAEAVKAVAEEVGRIAAAAAKAAVAVGRKTGFPVSLVFLAVGFLVLQDRIDRRDPKLALAPVRGEPELAFDLPPECRKETV